ncbi:MAG: hypothetical protein NVSMB57_02410 [Actinomycetota bacterium]
MRGKSATSESLGIDRLDDSETSAHAVPAALSGDGIATIMHELKTPLTSLIGYARMVRGNWTRMSDLRREECFDQVERQGRRILHMIDDLLESQRLDAGEPRIHRSRVDLQGVVHHAVDTVAGIVDRHLIVVEMPKDDLGLFGDALAIEHVLTNLIENAVKHSPRGAKVCVRVEEHESEVTVSVADDGPGISAEDLPHVFERFRRANEHAAAGMGLGLYIVRGLIAAHGGRVWVESIRGHGTTFTIALPRRSASNQADRSS